MITYKDIFGTLGIVLILFGFFTEYNGLSLGDTLIKSGIAILVFTFVLSRIRIPMNSTGTPIGRELVHKKFRSN